MYKGIISWAILIGKILKKNAASKLAERSKAIAIPATTKKIMLYVDPANPASMSMQFTDYKYPKCSIGCKLRLLDQAGNKMAEFTFTLTTLEIKDINGNLVPDLLNSLMEIYIVDEANPLIRRTMTDVAIKDFTPDKLIDLVRHTYGI